MMHSYTLEINEARLPEDDSSARMVARMTLPNLEVDICRRLVRLGYNFRSQLNGVILTDRELDPQYVHGIESFSEQYGVPVTLRYRKLD